MGQFQAGKILRFDWRAFSAHNTILNVIVYFQRYLISRSVAQQHDLKEHRILFLLLERKGEELERIDVDRLRQRGANSVCLVWRLK